MYAGSDGFEFPERCIMERVATRALDLRRSGSAEGRRDPVKRFITVIIICSLLFSALALAEGATEEPADGGKEGSTVIGSNMSFDQELIGFIRAQNERENYIVSPLSLRAALMLAVEGADASTRSQLLGAMGFASDEERLAWYAEVRESVARFEDWVNEQERLAEEEAPFYPAGKAPEMPVHAYRVLNSVWNNADRFGAFLPDYVRCVEERYGAAAACLPAAQITDAVNRWCDEATAGLIPKIAEDLSESAAALVNAVYLKSSWVDSFSEDMTEPEDFTNIDGEVTRRDMMKAKGRYRYYEDGDTKLVSVPLNGGLTFVAVLGDDADWLADLSAAEYADVDLWLPKLDSESSFGKEALVRFLEERGAVDAFDAKRADFSRMADFPWYISDILQKAKIRTDEEGLEAAAVTMIVMREGVPPEEEEPQYREFHANEAFRYYIVTTSTAAPLVVFAGQEVK